MHFAHSEIVTTWANVRIFDDDARADSPKRAIDHAA